MSRECTDNRQMKNGARAGRAIFHRRAGESGYALLAVIFILFVLTISLSVAMPKIRKSLQREQEIETQQRGKQYIRAIQLYYRQFNTFPPSIDALMKQNNIRYLRKKYKDPTTGKEEWKLVRYGQAKTQTLGFFGRPIAGGALGGGIGPVGVSTNTNLFGGNPTDSSSTQGSSTQPDSSTQPTGTSSSTQPSGSGFGSGQSGFSGSGQSGQSAFGSPNQSQAGSGTGLTGQTFGGGGIIGVEPGNPKATLMVYRKKSHFNEWEFIYDPALEMYYQSGAAGVPNGQPANGTNPTGNTGFGSGSSGFGSGTGSSGFGGTGSGLGGNSNGNSSSPSPFQ